jgi:hypothetical protein
LLARETFRSGQRFLEKHCAIHGKKPRGFTDKANERC